MKNREKTGKAFQVKWLLRHILCEIVEFDEFRAVE